SRWINPRQKIRVASSESEALRQIGARPPDVMVFHHGSKVVAGEALFEIVATFFPHVHRVLYSGLFPGEWRTLLERGLAQAVADQPDTLNDLLDSFAS